MRLIRFLFSGDEQRPFHVQISANRLSLPTVRHEVILGEHH
jgi:hypothetical protein